MLVARLTVECHKFLNGLFYKHTTHGPSRTTLAPSSPFRVGKILIYVNTDYHKLHDYPTKLKKNKTKQNKSKKITTKGEMNDVKLCVV